MAAQKKGWVFTLNNYSEEDVETIKQRLDGLVVAAILGKETCPTTGTRHIQGYCLFKKRTRFGRVKQILPSRCHIEPAKGSPNQNYEYCSKEGNTIEIGKFTKRKSQDLDLVCEKLQNGTTMVEIAKEFPTTFVRYSRGLQALSSLLSESKKRDFKSEVIVLIGKTGTGKSKWCADCCRSKPTYYKPRGPWWDGYSGQDNVILDDFYGWISYDELLRLLDAYPLRVPTKGGFAQFCSKRIFITSNLHYKEWYKFRDYEPSALQRRIDKLYIDEIPINLLSHYTIVFIKSNIRMISNLYRNRIGRYLRR
jgi:hypothetical protein